MTKIALIGGTGLAEFPGLEEVGLESIETPYGETSAPLIVGRLLEQDIVFLPRHGKPHSIPPHCINYRANLWALNEFGVSHVLAVNAVGGIAEEMGSGHICIPDQIVDYTFGREHSYSDSAKVPLQHVDFTNPYDEGIREKLIAVVQALSLPIHTHGTYAATQGPRLETAAEIDRLERDGCHLVGMTGMPEAVLARELDLPYASICLVVNKAAGRNEGIITMEEIEEVMETGIIEIQQLILQYLQSAS